MALTYGFYNSLNGDRKYDAIQLSSIFDGIISDGVFKSIGTAFAVTASTGRVVIVGAGRAWLDHTWTLNDTPFQLTLDVSDPLLHRIDTVVLQVDTRVANRINSIYIVKGTNSAEPQAPALIETGDNIQYPLCDIYVAAQATTILQANITNRIGTADLPYVNVIDADLQIGDRLYTANNYIADNESITASLNKIDVSVKSEMTAVQLRATNLEAIATPLGNLTANKALMVNSIGKIAVSAVSATELGYLAGVTSPIQTQINNIAPSTLIANRVLISDGLAKVAVSTITPTELAYLSGLTSNVQTQLNEKASSDQQVFTINRVLVSDVNGHIAPSTINTTIFGYLANVASDIQTQLNARALTIVGAATTILSSNLTASKALISDGSGKVGVSPVSATELGYVAGVTSAIQTQMNGKLGSTAQAADTLKIGGYKITVGVATPTGAQPGDLWIDTN